MNNKLYWFNFVTQDYELIDTPTDFTNYIPQLSAAQNLYKLHIQTGKQPIEAALSVLNTCIGDKGRG